MEPDIVMLPEVVMLPVTTRLPRNVAEPDMMGESSTIIVVCYKYYKPNLDFCEVYMLLASVDDKA